MIKSAELCVVMRSPLANCLVKLNVLTVCGRRLDNLKKRRNMYRRLNTTRAPRRNMYRGLNTTRGLQIITNFYNGGE